MQKTRLAVIIVFMLLIGSNVIFGVQLFLAEASFKNVDRQLKAQETNAKVHFFAKLFIEKVLLGSGTVNFEDRLKLENAVRDIDNQQIFDQWKKFTTSATDADAQRSAGQLLNLLIDNMDLSAVKK